jgi:hypothetical protein
VALGIAVAQGCQGPARGLGGDRRQEHVQPVFTPLDESKLMSQRYESTMDADTGAGK